MYVIKKAGPVLLNMAIFVANIIVAAKSHLIGVPADLLRLISSVQVIIFVILGYYILKAHRIYFDQQNIYIESIYNLNEINIVPVKDIISFEMTMLRSNGANYYRLEYVRSGDTIQKLFVPDNKNLALFKQLLEAGMLPDANTSSDTLA